MMARNADETDDASVLRSKRDATRYQILVGIAERQPAVSQREIADEIGVTAQAVSDYLRDLVAEGYVTKHGRGRYEVTNEGVDWLMAQTDDLRAFVEHVTRGVIGQVEIETAIATTEITEGETVSRTMQDGVLCVMAGATGTATAVAITDADPGRDVAITNFEGVIEYDRGTVTVVSIPSVQDGGSAVVSSRTVTRLAETHDLVAAAGTESLAALRAATIEPDIRFGTAPAVAEAATKGLDVLVLATTDLLSTHTDELRESNVSYEVIDAAEE